MKTTASIALPILLEPEKLKADMAKIPSAAWIDHYRGDHYEGGWSVAPLRSVCGHPGIIYSAPGGTAPGFYKDTPILAQCSYFREVIGWFQCQVNGARLMRLDAGSRILEHTDQMDASDVEELRIHIPVQTNPQVEFWVDGSLVPMLEGEVWYANFNLPHSVNNFGNTARTHLVLDCSKNEWLEKQLEKGLTISKIVGFLRHIGIAAEPVILQGPTFLPGINIERGKLRYDPCKLGHPGDLLHEAGHLAVVPSSERSTLSGDLGTDDANAMGYEIAAILWSYAAAKHLGLPAREVFHHDGYKGQSEWHLSNFEESRNYVGLPLLAWMGLAAQPGSSGPAFPEMLRWLRA